MKNSKKCLNDRTDPNKKLGLNRLTVVLMKDLHVEYVTTALGNKIIILK